LLALALLSFAVYCSPPSQAQDDSTSSQAADHLPDRLFDRVIAVVNNQVILASDLTLEMQIFHLLPIGDPQDATPVKALERLTTRALIEQQILQEDPQGLEIPPKELEDSLVELRGNLPACKQRDCTTPAGWAAYLATFDLTPDRVASYWSNRMALLKFIERRFRAGIRVSPEEIQKFYQDNLVPRYAKPEDAPKLDRVSPRIQEIILQQEVNALLNEWLKSLQSQGQVEILEPSLREAATEPVAAPVPLDPPASGVPALPIQSRPKTVSPSDNSDNSDNPPLDGAVPSTTPPLGKSKALFQKGGGI